MSRCICDIEKLVDINYNKLEEFYCRVQRHKESESVLRILFNIILEEVIVYVEQILKTMGEFKLLNPKYFGFGWLKCSEKSVYVADLPNQASRIQEVANIMQELKLSQILAEGTILLHQVLTIPTHLLLM